MSPCFILSGAVPLSACPIPIPKSICLDMMPGQISLKVQYCPLREPLSRPSIGGRVEELRFQHDHQLRGLQVLRPSRGHPGPRRQKPELPDRLPQRAARQGGEAGPPGHRGLREEQVHRGSAGPFPGPAKTPPKKEEPVKCGCANSEYWKDVPPEYKRKEGRPARTPCGDPKTHYRDGLPMGEPGVAGEPMSDKHTERPLEPAKPDPKKPKKGKSPKPLVLPPAEKV